MNIFLNRNWNAITAQIGYHCTLNLLWFLGQKAQHRKWPDIGNRPKYPSYIKGEFKSPQPYPTRKFNCQTKPNQKCKIPTHGSFETLRFFSLTRIQVFYNSVYIFYSYLWLVFPCFHGTPVFNEKFCKIARPSQRTWYSNVCDEVMIVV